MSLPPAAAMPESEKSNGSVRATGRAFSHATRNSNLDAMQADGVELLVIGGGITGAGIARDAAMRGLHVGLVERGDFASGTSSRSSKLIHGGLRYLAQGDISLVREAARERFRLRKMASHLAAPERMMLPVWGRTTAGLLKLRAGLWAFEKMAPIEESELHESWGRDETLARLPTLAANGLQGAVVYTEYVTDDARLTLETLKSAERHGALCINYAPAIGIEILGTHAVTSGNGKSAAPRFGVQIRDAETGEVRRIEARCIVNAAGPWVDAVRQLAAGAQPRMQLTKGIHLVVPRERLPIEHIVVMPAADRRMVFAVPQDDVIWIGTTDTFYPTPLERPEISRADVDYLLEATTRAFPSLRLGANDVTGAWAGVRPLVAEEGKSPSEISRRDEIVTESPGFFSIGGGKLTTYRAMAEKVVDGVERCLERSPGRCTTHEEPLVDSERKIAMARTTLDDEGIDEAIDTECALTVADVLERRTRANLFAADNGIGDLERVATHLGRRFGWNDERTAREMGIHRQRVAEDLAWRIPS